VADAAHLVDEEVLRDETRTPAPSPVLPSASTAPRCQRAFRALIASSTTSRRGLPSMAQTRPTPQASRSVEGSMS
jgi:hypothetical protein